MRAKDISLQRAKELKTANKEFLTFKKMIRKQEILDEAGYQKKKKELLTYFKADEEDWQDYKWQMRNRIVDVDTLQTLIKQIDLLYLHIIWL
jgi:hypothetical protein